MKRPSSNPSSLNGASAGATTSTAANHRYASYQAGGYQPPVHYASDQTHMLEDTTRAYHQADDTAGNVLTQMTAQRQQLESAHDSVWQMRQATEKAKREIEELHAKYRSKKNRLYAMIAAVAVTDLLLLFRLIQCRGSFFC